MRRGPRRSCGRPEQPHGVGLLQRSTPAASRPRGAGFGLPCGSGSSKGLPAEGMSPVPLPWLRLSPSTEQLPAGGGFSPNPPDLPSVYAAPTRTPRDPEVKRTVVEAALRQAISGRGITGTRIDARHWQEPSIFHAGTTRFRCVAAGDPPFPGSRPWCGWRLFSQDVRPRRKVVELGKRDGHCPRSTLSWKETSCRMRWGWIY